MVKKLFKHEFLAWLRIMPICYSIPLVAAAFNRIIQLFESDSIYYDLIITGATALCMVTLLVCIAAPIVFGVTRFYKNLFSGEGYLSFSLPVTTDNHLWAKVLTAVCFSVLSVLMTMLSLMIVTSGDLFSAIYEAIQYVVGRIPKEAAGHMAAYCVELTLTSLVTAFETYLMYYTCICIGQLFRKNRILAAVGVYFGFYVISQVSSTAMSVMFMILEGTGRLEWIDRFIVEQPFETVHIILCGGLVLNAVMSLVYYLVCRVIIRRKLNLE